MFKLFLSLAGIDDPRTTKLAKEQERTLIVDDAARWVAKYLHGAGDSSRVQPRCLHGPCPWRIDIAKGLLRSTASDLDNKGAAYRAGSAVWCQWRHAVLAAQGHPPQFEEMVLDLPGFLQQPPVPPSLVAAPIEAVAVWDTVGSLGIPVFTGQHIAVDLFQFADTALNDNVHFGRHAVSIDEQRENFTPDAVES